MISANKYLLQYVKELGNNTPEIIRRVDTMIFRALVDLATGQKEISSVLGELCDQIPWDELELLGKDVRSWFAAGKSS